MLAILRALPIPTIIAQIVYRGQPLRILRESLEELVPEPINLEPLLNDGVLVIASLTSEAEEAQMVDLAEVLEDDEATTAALALLSARAMGVDGPSTTKLLRQRLPDIQLVSTPILIKHWFEYSQPPSHTLQAALQHIYLGTGYTPPVHHPLYPWWQEVLEMTQNEPI